MKNDLLTERNVFIPDSIAYNELKYYHDSLVKEKLRDSNQ